MDSFYTVLLPMVLAGIMAAGITVVQRVAVQGKKKSFLLFLSGSQMVLVGLFAGVYLVRWGSRCLQISNLAFGPLYVSVRSRTTASNTVTRGQKHTTKEKSR